MTDFCVVLIYETVMYQRQIPPTFFNQDYGHKQQLSWIHKEVNTTYETSESRSGIMTEGR